MSEPGAGRGRFYIPALIPLLVFLAGTLLFNEYYLISVPVRMPGFDAALMTGFGLVEIAAGVAVFRRIRAAGGALRGGLLAVMGTPCGVYTLLSVLLGMLSGSP